MLDLFDLAFSAHRRRKRWMRSPYHAFVYGLAICGLVGGAVACAMKVAP
jgi:hypothetical protein